MVSFSCENCGDVLTKKKLDPHRNRCHGATFTCIDCMTYFPGVEYRSHTSCISEEQKYQGALYKPKKDKRKQQQDDQQNQNAQAPNESNPKDMAHVAYVEDAPEDYDESRAFDDDEDDVRPRNGPLPHAPTPPSAVEQQVNVFDFLVGNPTPKASNSDLRAAAVAAAAAAAAAPEDEKPSESTQLVRFEYDATAYLDKSEEAGDEKGDVVRYGTSGPVAASSLATPAPKSEKKKSKDGDAKKDKKRKRLHLDIHDSVMTDAPPILHSGLTGGLKGLMRGPSVFPPSPEYSADAAETPASPLKKSRHSKHSKGRVESIGNNLMSMLTAASSSSSSKPKTKKRKHGSPSAKKSSKHKHKHDAEQQHHHHHHHHHDKSKKMIEYRPGSKDSSKDGDKADKDRSVVVFGKQARPADLLLSLVNKGPDSERGCSMNKALKRYHRERSQSGTAVGKLMDEKELWRSLRLRKNDRGEVVLFCV